MASVLLVGAASTENSSDTAIRNLLEGDGHTVTFVEDAATEWGAGAEGDFDLVVVATTDATALGSKYQGTTLPVIPLYSHTWTGFGLHDGTVGSGPSTGGTTVAIIDDTHPLAGGLTGTVTVYSAGGDIFIGPSPAAVADLVAREPGGSDRWAIMDIEAGETLADGSTTAPGPRIAFGIAYADTWNANGETLFVAAVDHALPSGSSEALTADIALMDFDVVGEMSNIGVTVNASGELVFTAFDLNVSEILAYITGESEISFGTEVSGGLSGFLTAVIESTIAFGTEMTIAAASTRQRIADVVIDLGTRLEGTITGGDPVVVAGVKLIKRGAGFVKRATKDMIKTIVRRYNGE